MNNPFAVSLHPLVRGAFQSYIGDLGIAVAEYTGGVQMLLKLETVRWPAKRLCKKTGEPAVGCACLLDFDSWMPINATVADYITSLGRPEARHQIKCTNGMIYVVTFHALEADVARMRRLDTGKIVDIPRGVIEDAIHDQIGEGNYDEEGEESEWATETGEEASESETEEEEGSQWE